MKPGGKPGAFPFRDLMGAAICHLHWTPDYFWRATNHEFQSAQEAQERANKAADAITQRARRGK